MLSVENFYWVIHETLLRPSDIGCRYFYPFGTLDHLSVHEYDQADLFLSKGSRYVLFYDQEPFYNETLPVLDQSMEYDNWFKSLRILANSEISDIKKEFCRSRGMLDWYFFYHGFAALSWFKDARFIDHDREITSAFLCFNHLVKTKRSYRMSLLARLISSNSQTNGSISFHGSKQDCIDEINDPCTELTTGNKILIKKHLIDSDIELPIKLDQISVDGSLSARFGYHEHKLWQKSLFHVVTETVFYDQKLHLTEKIFKPIVAKRPFLLVASPGNLEYLKSYGFKTFDNWIDESYDQIHDNDQRLDLISLEIDRLSKKSISEIRDMHREMQYVLEFNKKHFFGEFRKVIVDELISNFDKCIKFWNNNRINYSCLPHPNLTQAKNILLQ